MSDKITLGTRIASARAAKGITVKQLADTIGLKNHTSITKIEKGNTDIRVSTLQRIARALGVSAADLLEAAP